MNCAWISTGTWGLGFAQGVVCTAVLAFCIALALRRKRSESAPLDPEANDNRPDDHRVPLKEQGL